MAPKVYLKSYSPGETSAPRKRQSTRRQAASRCFCTRGAAASSQGSSADASYRRAACLESGRPEITQLESRRAGIQTQAPDGSAHTDNQGPCCVCPCLALLRRGRSVTKVPAPPPCRAGPGETSGESRDSQ